MPMTIDARISAKDMTLYNEGKRIILVRTHYFDDELAAFLDQLAQTERPIVLVIDETKVPVATPEPWSRISLTRKAIQDLGLIEVREVGWVCGDYSFYLAREIFPEATHFWLIEPDVYLKFDRICSFFDYFDVEEKSAGSVDLLACFIKPTRKGYFWDQGVRPFFANSFRCLYPVLRLSARAADAMLGDRRRIGGLLVDVDLSAMPQLWTNDEGITATSCMAAGLDCRDVNSFGKSFYSEKTFSFERPLSYRRLEALPPDGMFYHPVLAGEKFTAKIFRQLKIARNRPEIAGYLAFTPEIVEDLRLEGGQGVAERFAVELADFKRKIAPNAPMFSAMQLAWHAREWFRQKMDERRAAS